MRDPYEKQECQHEDHLAPLDALKRAIREVLREELAALRLPVADADRLLDVDEAALRLGLSASTIYKRAERCELPSVKIGGRLLFEPADLDAYAQSKRRSPERVRKLAGEP